MKLLLASSGKSIIKFLPQIANRPITGLRIAWVTTASKGVNDLTYLDWHKKAMTAAGWDFEAIDIEGKTVPELQKIFNNKDIIYIAGGNTFYLLKAVKETGFDAVIKKAIKKGVIYVGASASTYIMCPTIEMSTWKEDPRPRFGLKDLTALHIVPFLISAHYTPKRKQSIRAGIKKAKYPVKILTDEQALFIHDNKVELLGAGAEIKVS